MGQKLDTLKQENENLKNLNDDNEKKIKEYAKEKKKLE